MESVPVSDNLRIHSKSVKRKYTTTDIVIDREGTPTVVAKKSSGPIYYAGDTATISDPYRKERDNYLNDKEYQQQKPATCGKCYHFRSHGPYKDYHEMFQHKWICKVDSNDHALKRYRGWCKCEKCSQFATPELFQHLFTSRGHHLKKESSTPNRKAETLNLRKESSAPNRKPETLNQAKDGPGVMQNLIN